MLGSTATSSVMGFVPLMARALSTSSAAAAAVPAVATKSSGGLGSLLGFGSSRIDTPLTEPLPTAVEPLKGKAPTAAPALQSGSLESGTRVVAIDSVSPVSSVTLAFEAGSAFESDATLGASKVLEHLAFKATANRTTFRLTRELEKLGVIASAKAGRDHIAYTLSAVKLHTPEAVEILVDAVLNAKLSYWETAEAVTATRAALTAALRDPTNVISDVLHRAAYDGGLGQPLYLDPSLLDGTTNDTIKEYLASVLNPSSAVLVAAGASLDEITQLANPLVDKAAARPAPKPSSTYVGGALNVIANSPYTYVGLAIEAKGGLSDAKTAATAAVVKALLDESRAVLPHASKESDVFRSAAGFSSLYKSSGLVGLVASSSPAQAGQLTDAVLKKVESVAKDVSEAQLKQAKQLALGSYKSQVSTTSGLTGVLASQLLLTGKYNPTEFASSVAALTAADVKAFVAAGLKSPTLVSYGSMQSKVPRFDTILKRLA